MKTFFLFSLVDLWEGFRDEWIGFLGWDPWIKMISSGDYSVLKTLNGVTSATGALIPFLLILELLRAIALRGFRWKDYSWSFWSYVLNRFLSRYISIAVVSFCIGWLHPFALLKAPFRWYWLIYGYVIWEFAHFIYHYLAHKIRLFWCLHSTHHAPEHMNLSVSYAHFFLEAPYADFIRTSICILAGLEPELLFFIMFIDGTWGAFIHAGENLLKDGRLGFLKKWLLTPSHHRVHHARNPLYMDTNFCNLLPIWDRVFGTLQPEEPEMPPEYGITRKMEPSNFLNAYFGELPLLWRDVKNAPGIRNKLLYLVMPPGWSPSSRQHTARSIRQNYLLVKKRRPQA